MRIKFYGADRGKNAQLWLFIGPIKSANLSSFSNIALSTVVLSNLEAFKVPFFKHEAAVFQKKLLYNAAELLVT